ncbi:MAG: hypothetical protein H0T59_09575 [Chloroflexi bacterium]|nr:hypothetical protein [Chloroflexota bacterium]
MDDHTKDTDPDTDVESVKRRGEDVGREEKEEGRQDGPDQGSTDRPTGTSTPRDMTGIDPSEKTPERQ